MSKRRDYGSDPKLPFYKNFCQCSGCGRYFGGPRSFDTHRIGEGKDRHCADPVTLLKKNGKPKLMLNSKGYWVEPWSDKR